MSRIHINQESYARLLDVNGNGLTSTGGALDIAGALNVSVASSTTTAWDVSGTDFIPDNSYSTVHDATQHGTINIYGSTAGTCTLIVEFSAASTGAAWYPTDRTVSIPSSGMVDGTFSGIAAKYLRLRKTTGGDISGTILITGKGI